MSTSQTTSKPCMESRTRRRWWLALLGVLALLAVFGRRLVILALGWYFCHQPEHSILGPLALRPSELPHRTTVDPGFGANTLCVRCHAATSFPGEDLQRDPLPTFEEHAQYRAQGGQLRCVECHFPVVDAP